MSTPTPGPTPAPEAGAPRTPAVLRVVAVVAVAQGLATVVLGAFEGLAVDSERAVMGLTTALFFVAYGALLCVCGVALWRPARWARGPVLFAQLVWLPVAWSLRGGQTTWLAALVAVSAVVSLVCLLQPAVIRASNKSKASVWLHCSY